MTAELRTQQRAANETQEPLWASTASAVEAAALTYDP